MKGVIQHSRNYKSHERIPMQRQFPSLRSQCHLEIHEKFCIGGVCSNKNWHKEEKCKEVCQGSEEGHAQFWSVCRVSIDTCVYMQGSTKNMKLRDRVVVQVNGVFSCIQKWICLVGGVGEVWWDTFENSLGNVQGNKCMTTKSKGRFL